MPYGQKTFRVIAPAKITGKEGSKELQQDDWLDSDIHDLKFWRSKECVSEKYHELYFDDDEWLSAATYVQSLCLLNKRPSGGPGGHVEKRPFPLLLCCCWLIYKMLLNTNTLLASKRRTCVRVCSCHSFYHFRFSSYRCHVACVSRYIAKDLEMHAYLHRYIYVGSRYLYYHIEFGTK